MNKILIAILIISILGNFIGLFILYKYFGAKKAIEYVRQDLNASNESVGYLTGLLDNAYEYKMIFLHHSVGKGILNEGGLRDSLLKLGVFVKGATYGDDIGEQTDICNWLPKFQNNMDKILSFKNHTDIYYEDGQSNDIVMLKSCYPNSQITGDGSLPGDPLSSEKTIANYKATFEGLKEEIKKYPDKLFIYWTSPPLRPEATTPENAHRAIEFNAWLTEEFLSQSESGAGMENLKIFDLFKILADDNGYLKEDFRRDGQSNNHPNLKANQIAAAKFLEYFKPILDSWKSKSQLAEIK